MSKNYENDHSFYITLNIPPDLALARPIPSELRVDIGGDGWDLLRLSLFKKKDSIRVSTGRRLERVIPESELKRDILDHLGTSGINVIRVFPDHLDIELEERATKSIPVLPLLDYKVMESKGILVQDPFFNPSSVMVTGPVSLVDPLDTLYVEILDSLRLGETFINTYAIPSALYPLLDFEPIDLLLTIEIERVTQKEWLVPLKIEGGENRVDLLPDKVLLKGQLGISKYDQFVPGDFRFYVDLRDTGSDNELVVKYSEMPEGVRYLSHSPRTVEFYYSVDSNGIESD
jgi:hypothetical protein